MILTIKTQGWIEFQFKFEDPIKAIRFAETYSLHYIHEDGEEHPKYVIEFENDEFQQDEFQQDEGVF